MSNSDQDDDVPESSSVAGVLYRWYHVPVLGAIVATMLAIRLQSYDRFIRDGKVYLSGNDAWYHLRSVRYTVRNWPSTIPYDPWTGFPSGRLAGQFGTLFDQIIATAAIIIGLGSPSPELVAKTTLVAPAVFGALIAIPTFLIGRRLGNRVSGIIGAVVLMLLPGTFLRRGLVGFADHNVAEPLFMGFAVLAILVALRVADDDPPVWELVEQREWDVLRRPAAWSALAGVAVALYLWVWPPGILLVGIFAAYLAVQQVSDHVNGDTPEPTAFVGAVSMSVTGVMMLLVLEEGGFGVTGFSFLHPVIAFGTAAGSVFLAWFTREWGAREFDTEIDMNAVGYPLVVLLLAGIALATLITLLPEVWGRIERNVFRILAFSAGAETRTIGEAQPFLSPDIISRQRTTAIGRIVGEYGFSLFAGVAAAAWMHAKPLVKSEEVSDTYYAAGGLGVLALMFVLPSILGAISGLFGVDEQILGLVVAWTIIVGATLRAQYDPEQLFAVVWAGFMTSAAFTQVRFNYYLAVVVAVFVAYGIGELVSTMDVEFENPANPLENVEFYQVAVVVVALMLVLTPVLIVPVDVGQGRTQSQTQTAPAVGNSTGPGGFLYWESSLEWLEANTPEEGTYGGADNRLEKYGTYQRPADGDFQYPEGVYGVMSWWDYGHWITVEGDRIPNANPFQQNARAAANYLLAPSEERANELLEQQGSAGEETRYVMVDWQMATPGSKFGAPVTFYDDGDATASDFRSYVYYENQDGQVRQGFFLKDQRYYESMMIRLYEYHGSAVEAQPVVVNYRNKTYTNRQTGESTTLPVIVASENETGLQSFDDMSAARAYADDNPTAQVGGFGPNPQRDVAALEHYRLVKASETSAFSVRSYARQRLLEAQALGIPQFFAQRFLERTQPSYVKTFERVPGATVQGSGAPANTTVTATVQMNVPTTNSTFVYRQHARTNADGEFTMTLPYSTTGYDDLPAGYTNVSVRANTSYTITTPVETLDNGTQRNYGATVDVSERKIVGVDETPEEVELTPRYGEPEGANANESDGNQSALAAPSAVSELRTDGDDRGTFAAADSTPALATPKVAVRG